MSLYDRPPLTMPPGYDAWKTASPDDMSPEEEDALERAEEEAYEEREPIDQHDLDEIEDQGYLNSLENELVGIVEDIAAGAPNAIRERRIVIAARAFCSQVVGGPAYCNCFGREDRCHAKNIYRKEFEAVVDALFP